MLNVVDSISIDAEKKAQLAAQLKYIAKHKQLIEASRRFPNKQIAAMLSILYAFVVICCGLVLRIACRERPDDLARKLAGEYCAVPEMILHKLIEIRALLRCRVDGDTLDLGCGDGRVGSELRRNGTIGRLDGIDLSSNSPEALMRRGYNSYICGDIQDLPIASETYKSIVSICVVEHVPNLDSVIREVHRVLKPGGVFVFTTPAPLFRKSLLFFRLMTAVGFRKRAERFQMDRDVSAFHMHYHTMEDWQRILGNHGFCNVDVAPIFSRRQLAIYDAMNCQVYFLRYYFYERLTYCVERFQWVRSLMQLCGAEVAAAAANCAVSIEDATHYCISSTKAPS